MHVAMVFVSWSIVVNIVYQMPKICTAIHK